MKLQLLGNLYHIFWKEGVHVFETITSVPENNLFNNLCNSIKKI